MNGINRLTMTLKDALERLEHLKTSTTRDSAARVSKRYLDKAMLPAMTSADEAIAYAFTRMPATYAVNQKVLTQLPSDYVPHQILDLGAGPGTALLAAKDLWPEVHMTAVESNPYMIHIFQQLHPSVTLIQQDIKRSKFNPSDLTILSYVLNELDDDGKVHVLQQAWRATQDYLILIEPGTPYGFENIRQARALLIRHGACVLAPCGHTGPCPMRGGDWCHFKVRLPRASTHRHLKDATMNYEDEAYSYLVLSKHPVGFVLPRIIKRPMARGGHIHITVCTEKGLKEDTVTRVNPDYKRLRKLGWGDVLERQDI